MNDRADDRPEAEQAMRQDKVDVFTIQHDAKTGDRQEDSSLQASPESGVIYVESPNLGQQVFHKISDIISFVVNRGKGCEHH